MHLHTHHTQRAITSTLQLWRSFHSCLPSQKTTTVWLKNIKQNRRLLDFRLTVQIWAREGMTTQCFLSQPSSARTFSVFNSFPLWTLGLGHKSYSNRPDTWKHILVYSSVPCTLHCTVTHTLLVTQNSPCPSGLNCFTGVPNYKGCGASPLPCQRSDYWGTETVWNPCGECLWDPKDQVWVRRKRVEKHIITAFLCNHG